MAQDLDTLLKTLEGLNRAVKEPGTLSRAQLEAEVKKLTGEVKEALADVGSQLPPEAVGASVILVDIFKAQLGAVLQQSGLDLDQSEEMRKLSEELELIKRSYIPS